MILLQDNPVSLMKLDENPSPVRLAVVLVTYNRRATLVRSLKHLLAAGATDVTVVDNASNDGTGEWLAGLDDRRLNILTLPENSGGAGGFESGIAHVLRGHEPDWVLLLDDDAWPEPDALHLFAEGLPHLPEDTGAVAAAVRLPSGRIAEMNRPGYNPFWHLPLIWKTLTRGNRAGFKLPDSAYQPDAGLTEVDNASFVGYFIARKAWRQAGLPEGGLFIYGDDVLYSLRLRKAGLRIMFQPNVRFVHDCGSMDANFVYRPLWKVYYHCRNGVEIARTAAGPLVFPFALLWYVMIWSRRGRHCKGTERRQYNLLMWRGILDGLRRKRGRNDDLGLTTPPCQNGTRISK